MRILRSVLVGCMLMAAALGVAGCSDQSEQANKLVDEMNVLIEQSNALGAQRTQLVDDVNAVNPTGKDVGKATPMLAEARTKLDQEKKNLRAEASLIEQITALDVSDEMKEYAGKLKAITQVEEKELAVAGDLLSALGELYDPKKAGDYSQAELDKLTNRANDLISKSSALQSEIAGKQGAAEQYFEDNLK